MTNGMMACRLQILVAWGRLYLAHKPLLPLSEFLQSLANGVVRQLLFITVGVTRVTWVNRSSSLNNGNSLASFSPMVEKCSLRISALSWSDVSILPSCPLMPVVSVVQTYCQRHSAPAANKAYSRWSLGAPYHEPLWVGVSSIPSGGVFGSSGAVWFVSVLSGAWLGQLLVV